MGTVNRLLLYHRHYRRRQDYMAPHRFGHQVRSRLRWPRVFGTNSGHTLKPSRLYGRCTSSRIRVSLPTDVLWLFSQQHRFFYTTPNKVYYSLWMHTFRRSAAEFGVIRSINKKYTHGHAQMVVQRATARCTVFVRSCVLGLMLEWHLTLVKHCTLVLY